MLKTIPSKSIRFNSAYGRAQSLLSVLNVMRPETKTLKFFNRESANTTNNLAVLKDTRKEFNFFKSSAQDEEINNSRAIITTAQLVDEILQSNGHNKHHTENKNDWYLQDSDQSYGNLDNQLITLDLLWYMEEQGLDTFGITHDPTENMEEQSSPMSARYTNLFNKAKDTFKANIPTLVKEIETSIEKLKEADAQNDWKRWVSYQSENQLVSPKVFRFLRVHANDVQKHEDEFEQASVKPTPPTIEESLLKIHESHLWSYDNIMVALSLENGRFTDDVSVNNIFVAEDSKSLFSKVVTSSKYKRDADLYVSDKNIINSEVFKYRQFAIGEEFNGF